MTRTFSTIFAIIGLTFAISRLFPAWFVYLGLAIFLASPFLGAWLTKCLHPHVAATETRRKARMKAKAKRRFAAANRQQIAFHYLKATFSLAGYVAAADGHVCQHEKQVLEGRFYYLRLDNAQIQVAMDYFKQGQSPDFDVATTVNTFIHWCGHAPELCLSLLTTQFAFVEADSRVDVAELRAVSYIARRLGLEKRFQNLLESYRLKIEKAARESAREKVNEQQRRRDKQRFQTEKERLHEKLSPEERELRLALALLGLPPDAGITDIKRAYRQQIKRHHPDTLLANGYPEELLAEATRQSAEINRAYRLLKKHYRFR